MGSPGFGDMGSPAFGSMGSPGYGIMGSPAFGETPIGGGFTGDISIGGCCR
ncbi:MAG TPA: hypothetical protein VF692_00115 [Pyrinomonadaceae bacterium]